MWSDDHYGESFANQMKTDQEQTRKYNHETKISNEIQAPHIFFFHFISYTG